MNWFKDYTLKSLRVVHLCSFTMGKQLIWLTHNAEERGRLLSIGSDLPYGRLPTETTRSKLLQDGAWAVDQTGDKTLMTSWLQLGNGPMNPSDPEDWSCTQHVSDLTHKFWMSDPEFWLRTHGATPGIWVEGTQTHGIGLKAELWNPWHWKEFGIGQSALKSQGRNLICR